MHGNHRPGFPLRVDSVFSEPLPRSRLLGRHLFSEEWQTPRYATPMFSAASSCFDTREVNQKSHFDPEAHGEYLLKFITLRKSPVRKENLYRYESVLKFRRCARFLRKLTHSLSARYYIISNFQTGSRQQSNTTIQAD